MGYVAGEVVPGAHPQQHPAAWRDRVPFVAVRQDVHTRHWHMVGFDGAQLLNRDEHGHGAVNAFGVSDFDLGPLNGAVFGSSLPVEGPLAGKIVFFGDDGGTFIPIVQVHYPTSG